MIVFTVVYKNDKKKGILRIGKWNKVIKKDENSKRWNEMENKKGLSANPFFFLI